MTRPGRHDAHPPACADGCRSRPLGVQFRHPPVARIAGIHACENSRDVEIFRRHEGPGSCGRSGGRPRHLAGGNGRLQRIFQQHDRVE